MNKRDKEILRIALPSIVSNITVPLLGLIDVAIVGHMGSAAYIGAVAVGSMIFNLLYWLFAFLRMGTSGMTSQALGQRNLQEDARILLRSMVVALGIALVLIVLQIPLKELMFLTIGPTADVVPYATTYFYIVVWGAPAMLGLYSLSGWFIGMQNTRIPMFISIMQNVVNIIASLLLVYGLEMKVEGVALGTVIAQYAGFLAGVAMLFMYYRKVLRKGNLLNLTNLLNLINLLDVINDSAFRRFFTVNRDIFLRTLCLVSVNLYFTAAGARNGAVVLSANTVLMQLYLLFSYFMDGFAYAGEALGGRFYGAHNRQAFSEMLRRLWLWAAGVTLLYTCVYVVFGPAIVALLTDEPLVRTAATHYLPWVWLVPVASVLAFIWDGIFIGLTATRGMLASSFIAALLFFAVSSFLPPLFSFLVPHFSFRLPPSSFLDYNHFLWLAQIVYLATRGLVQTVWYRRYI